MNPNYWNESLARVLSIILWPSLNAVYSHRHFEQQQCGLSLEVLCSVARNHHVPQ
jgi:hypothetical protein